MPAPSRNEVAEKRRTQRRESSPYNQRGRKDKMAASRGWRPTIWKALTFWRSEDTQSSDEDSDPSEEVAEPNVGENGKDAGTQVQEVVEDGNDADSSSMMNSSIVSEDQVFRQLISPTPRQVRFQLPSPSLNSRRISPFQPGPSVPFTSRRQQPYVAPLPPSSSLNKTGEDPLEKVSQYLDNVIRPRGGEVSGVEAMGLTMLIQSAVKGDYSQQPLEKPPSDHYLLGSNSATSTPSRDVSPNHNPFVFLKPETPLKPTFTTPNTNFAAIFSQPDTTTTTTSSTTKYASSSRSLTRNPNGTVMFQGGSSAKSRYRSSAFGTSSSRKKVTFSRDFGESKIGSSNGISNLTSSTSDGKRRRIDEERSSSAVASSTPFFQTASSSSQTKEFGTGATALNGHGTIGTSRAQAPTSAPVSAPSNIRLGGSNNRFTSTTPVRPSPLRQSMRADSSSPGSPSSNRGTPEAKTNGKIAKQSEAKALAIMTEIIQSASRPKDEQASSLNPDLTNPYDTRPASKRARKSTKPARPPPRPARRTVSAEITPPPQPPRKPTALETIEQSAPSSVQAQSKRVHAEMTGSSPQSHKPKRPSPVIHDVIEIDDDDDDEQPPAKRAKPEKTKPLEPIKESVEIIDIDGDVDMTTPAPASTNNVLRPSEIVEPMESDASDTSKPAVSRTLYPTSLSKASNGFGVTPKKPSPLRNSFQPESDNSTPTNVAPSKPKQPETTTTSLFGSAFTTAPVFPVTSSGESSQVSSPSSSFTSTATTTTATSLFGGSSTFSFGSASSNTSFSSVPKFGASSTEDKILTTTPSTNGFTFSQAPTVSTSSAMVSTGVTKPFQFGTSSSAFFPPTIAAFGKSSKVEDNEEAIKKAVLAVNPFTLPVFRFIIPPVVMDDGHSAERNAALALPVESLPKFSFDAGSVLKPALNVKSQQAASVPSKTEVKGFDWSAAGIKAPASSGWTCSVCSVPNKVSDSKCVCCGENAPVPKTEVKGFDWSAAGMKAPVSSGWTCRVCAVPNKSFE
ncbi:hypothetical protein Clacol_005253 [Clathrus columnatus]|uniref:RanBP2-type domain-containing protein n=1 Tax=Clathrus columnatus TaxID=1419009 RepID=A0AAV5A8T3_9AGAM|nr:hypothetical protein Clacol_005253 [Clathrus columnatus]